MLLCSHVPVADRIDRYFVCERSVMHIRTPVEHSRLCLLIWVEKKSNMLGEVTGRLGYP